MKLTKKAVDALECTGAKPKYLWDSHLAGFGVKALPSGKRNFIVKYRTHGGGRSANQRWITIGAHGKVTLDQARKQAQRILATVACGNDPQAERLKLRDAPRLLDAWERYKNEELPLKKADTIKNYTQTWKTIIAPKIGQIYVKDITKSDIEKLHKSLTKTSYRANRVLALVSRLMNLAEAWDWRDQGTNPCRFVKKFKEHSRERYLTQDELTRLGTSLVELVEIGDIWPDMANAITLLLLTGARKNEILTCKWEWVSWEHQIVFLPDSKTGKKPLYLSDAAVKVLDLQKTHSRDPNSAYVFPGYKKGQPLVNLAKPWGRICQNAGIEDVRLHDLRHTAASIAVGQGISLPIVGRLLGHSQAQTTLRYAHVDSDPALKAANVIGDTIGGLLRK